MKILLLNQTFYPDALATSQQLTDLALYLVELGHEVSVICDRSDYETRSASYPAYEEYRGIHIHRVRATTFGKRSFGHRTIDGMSFNLFAFFRMLQLPRQDLVVCFTSPPLVGFPGVVYAQLARSKSVQWLMDVNPDAAIAVGYLRPDSPVSRFLVAAFEYTMRNSSAVVVLDRWMREKALARGAEHSRMAIIPPWPAHRADTGSIEESGMRFRKAHGLEGKTVVMYSGNHSVVHPMDTLLDAAVALKDDPRIRFVFVGGGLRVRDVTRYVEQHRLKNVIQLPRQPREDIADMLAAADLHTVVLGDAVNGLVHASKIYGVLETGRPFVFLGQRQSHIGDLLPDFPCAFQVDHGNSQRLVEIIRRAGSLSEEDKAKHFRLAKRFIRERYVPEISMNQFVTQVLEKLASTEEARPLEAKWKSAAGMAD